MQDNVNDTLDSRPDVQLSPPIPFLSCTHRTTPVYLPALQMLPLLLPRRKLDTQLLQRSDSPSAPHGLHIVTWFGKFNIEIQHQRCGHLEKFGLCEVDSDAGALPVACEGEGQSCLEGLKRLGETGRGVIGKHTEGHAGALHVGALRGSAV